ncbi:hypothetical protein [Rhizobium sp. NXC24]|uniref:hypothetical protein n=1 Tax=Rhizobium sp. NXC24 TaxID=2048897 RepID=UPI000CDF4AB5|nr:hypothetical protein [Rhizobium sp. NXC24]AVA24222.1 endoribonuclease L-PSP protein [Rhizobium sp. NXC24]
MNIDGVEWKLPIESAHQLSASAGALSFVGGAGDFDSGGRIRNPSDLPKQVAGAVENLAAALDAESCTLDDVVRIKAHYTADCDDWDVIAALSRFFNTNPMPAISTVAEPLQPFDGQMIQLQAIAQRGWRSGPDVRSVARPIPSGRKELFGGKEVTAGLRAGEFIAVANLAAEEPDGRAYHPDEPLPQTHFIMQKHEETLAALGASFQDCIKMEGYHIGTTREDWVPLAKARLGYFRDPGPVATTVPFRDVHPEGAMTKIEVLAMRERRNGYDKYIPREDHWPERVWDWPIPAPYRQAIRLRDVIWLGGQVPFHPHTNTGIRVFKGQLAPQTRFTMGYVKDLLQPFGRTLADLKLMVCYFSSTGTEAETINFVRTLTECVGGVLPPLTLVPHSCMRDVNTVEIFCVAQG